MYVEIMGVALTPDEYEAFNYYACYTVGKGVWNSLPMAERLQVVKGFKRAEG